MGCAAAKNGRESGVVSTFYPNEATGKCQRESADRRDMPSDGEHFHISQPRRHTSGNNIMIEQGKEEAVPSLGNS